ncbi:metal-dependent transcriptional regulator [Hespellia stercorisuis]|uniref:metal-dependent transcriptional regulator n=1 Tax=Hespellia stercorisuis TaxID=180311 RepID=UPI0009FE2362|nr:metal-dependent transcriptional regulator [Hespellia stercorisuis]
MILGKSLEDYLEAILILKNKKGTVRSVDVANYMGFSKPGISHAVKELRIHGFLKMDNNGLLHLTESGQAVAEKIYERHCFFTQYLIDIGVEPKQAESDALISTLMPDLNVMVKKSSYTAIFSIIRLTSVSSNAVSSVGCALMKS